MDEFNKCYYNKYKIYKQKYKNLINDRSGGSHAEQTKADAQVKQEAEDKKEKIQPSHVIKDPVNSITRISARWIFM